MDCQLNLPYNQNPPTVMHIDLNSCFATVEQQANPLLRNKAIAVAIHNSPGCCIVAPSIEAKRHGVKVGMTVREGKILCPSLLILEPDPDKYRFVHFKMKKIFQDYSPDVTPKSIDEAVIDFKHTPSLARPLTDIGQEIKHRLRKEVGGWISCSVGISTNRFLAKTAASLHKPDGLDVITHLNLEQTMSELKLLDLCGINTRYQARLNCSNIFTPLDFLQTPAQVLQKQVFKSVVGVHWYLQLRGWELDCLNNPRRSFGQSQVIKGSSSDKKFLSQLLMKLIEKMGRRLRSEGYAAHGIQIGCLYQDHTYWHLSKNFSTTLYSASDLYQKSMRLFNQQPCFKPINKLAVGCFNLTQTHQEQIELFETEQSRSWKVSDALDQINDKYGEYTIVPALLLNTEDLVPDRIAFGI